MVTLSSTESELVAFTDHLSQAIWMNNFLTSQQLSLPPIRVFQDNQSTIALVRKKYPFSSRTKHLDIRYFFVRDKEQSKCISLCYCPTESMISDLLTKPLGGNQFDLLNDAIHGRN